MFRKKYQLFLSALVASMQKKFNPMFFAFAYGWFFSLSAITTSYFLDLHTGYSIVFMGALLTLSTIFIFSRPLKPKQSSLPGSDGEHKMQEHFHTQDKAEDFYDRQMLDYLAPHMKSFIKEQEMVFISTSDAHGECDSSFRSGEAGFVKVINDKTLMYADYKGNGVLASAGNISENPHIGMLFIDFFENKVGLHVNGKASILNEKELLSVLDKSPQLEDKNAYISTKNKTVFWVLVHVEEAYIHCSKNIPILKKESSSSNENRVYPIDFFQLKP